MPSRPGAMRISAIVYCFKYWGVDGDADFGNHIGKTNSSIKDATYVINRIGYRILQSEQIPVQRCFSIQKRTIKGAHVTDHRNFLQIFRKSV